MVCDSQLSWKKCRVAWEYLTIFLVTVGRGKKRGYRWRTAGPRTPSGSLLAMGRSCDLYRFLATVSDLSASPFAGDPQDEVAVNETFDDNSLTVMTLKSFPFTGSG